MSARDRATLPYLTSWTRAKKTFFCVHSGAENSENGSEAALLTIRLFLFAAGHTIERKP
jgi:hypothetical protein